MYALGGTIGTGLFVGIGGGLAQAGPLSLLLGYSITSVFIFFMVSECLYILHGKCPTLRRVVLQSSFDERVLCCGITEWNNSLG